MFLDVANETEQLDIGCGSNVPAYSATSMTGSQRSTPQEVDGAGFAAEARVGSTALRCFA